MSAEGIEAGRAYVELGVKDRLSAWLEAAKERLANWARGLTLLGAKTTGLATSVLAPPVGGVRHFADVGKPAWIWVRYMPGCAA